MLVPTTGKKSEELTPAEREERYGIRSLADLRRDVNAVFDWKADVLKDKNRQDSAISSLENDYKWALALSLAACVSMVGLLVYVLWG